MLCADEWVQVRCAGEILETLDQDGALVGMPFMPEMVAFCGKSFRVARRAERACVEFKPPIIPIRELISRAQNGITWLQTRQKDGSIRLCA